MNPIADADDMPAATRIDRGPGELTLRLRSAGRYLLLAGITTAVLWHGGTSHAAVGVVLLLCAAAWVCVAVDAPHRPTGIRAGWLWVALGVYTALQLLPLPRSLVIVLHPSAVELSDLGRAALGLQPATMLPIALATGDAAMQGAIYLVAGVLAVLIGSALMKPGGREDTEDLLRFIVWLIVISGGFWVLGWGHGIARRVPSEIRAVGQLLSFRNPNHEAGLMVAGLAIAFSRSLREAEAELLSMRAGAVICGVVCVFTGSRGGIGAGIFVVAMAILTLPRGKNLRRSERDRAEERLWRIVLSTLSAAIVIVMIGMPVLEKEIDFDTGAGQDISKLLVLGEVPELLKEGWLFGRAPGSVPVIVGEHGGYGQARLDFLENLVADRLVSGGLWGGLGFLCLLAWIVGRLLTRRRQGPWVAPALALVGVLLHDLVDFSLEVAGALVVFLAVASAAERLQPYRKPDDDDERAMIRRSVARNHRVQVAMSGGALALAAVLWQASADRLTRDVDTKLADLPLAELQSIVGSSYLYDHHALYVLGRKQLEAGKASEAVRALDHAIRLRPNSAHARLARLTARHAAGRTDLAADELIWLLTQPIDSTASQEMFHDVLDRVAGLRGGEEILVRGISRLGERSYSIGRWLRGRRPALVERLALQLRRDHPDRRFGIEAIRGLLYTRRGQLEPARRIAAELMADPKTELLGWTLEAYIHVLTGRPYEGHHLFDEVCRRQPDNAEACMNALDAIVRAKRPQVAKEYLRVRYPAMRRHPHQAYAYWMAAADVEQQLDNLEASVSAARRALGFRRNDRPALHKLVELFVLLGDRYAAENALARLAQANKNRSADNDFASLAEAVTQLHRKIGPSVR